MADESLEKSYLEVVDDIVLGARRTHPDWLAWFEATSAQAHFETRIKSVFEERGHIPSPTQFFRAKDDVVADQQAKTASKESKEDE
jgi:hypothetical protein